MSAQYLLYQALTAESPAQQRRREANARHHLDKKLAHRSAKRTKRLRGLVARLRKP